MLPFAEEGVRVALNATAALFGDPDALCRLPGKCFHHSCFKKYLQLLLVYCTCHDCTSLLCFFAFFSVESLEQLFADIPVTELDNTMCNPQTKVIDILHATGALSECVFEAYQLMLQCYATSVWCSSHPFAADQARQILSGGGIYLNQIRVQSASETFNPEVHVMHGRFSVLRIGG